MEEKKTETADMNKAETELVRGGAGFVKRRFAKMYCPHVMRSARLTASTCSVSPSAR